jgi:hypothetical protein
MKKYFITSSIFLLIFFVSFSQIQTPQPSPFSTTVQKVGLVDVTIEYSRPSMKGREIFGSLISYNELWRTGANQNSKITFSDDVRVGGSKVSKGTYSIYTRPSIDSWELILYKKSDNWGLPKKWNKSLVALNIVANSYDLPFQIETFTIALNNLSNNGATLDIFWENTIVSFVINSMTNDKVISSIKKTLNSTPKSQDYYNSAVFYLEESFDINMAKTWIDKCFELRDEVPYWMLNQKALIYFAYGDKIGAEEAAKLGLSLAKETKITDSIKTLKQTLYFIQSN